MACGIFPWKLFRCENNSLARAASALPTNPHATHFHLSHFSLNVCLKTAKLQSFDKTGTTYFFEQFTTMLSKSRLSLITYQTQHILILQYIFNWIFKVLVDCFNSKPSPQVRSSWSCWKKLWKTEQICLMQRFVEKQGVKPRSYARPKLRPIDPGVQCRATSVAKNAFSDFFLFSCVFTAPLSWGFFHW